MILSYEQEIRLLTSLFRAAGLSAEDAALLAEVPTLSDFLGVESHGLSRGIMYVVGLAKGFANAKAEFKILSETDATMKVDADDGVGVLSMIKTYGKLSEKAKKQGIAIAEGINSSNIGCGYYYAKKASEDNLILLACANTTPLQAPFGGADPMIGSNPIIAGVPSAGDFPVVLDMATTLVAFGKIQAAQRKGTPIPDSWCLDKEGRPTTDPNAYYTNVPFGSYKGYGLAVFVDMFAAVLSGAAYGTKIGFATRGELEKSGWSMILVDPSFFMPIDEFKERVNDYVGMMKNARKAEGVAEIFVPGEKEYLTYCKRMEEGFYVEPTLEATVLAVGKSIGLFKEDQSLEDFLKEQSTEI